VVIQRIRIEIEVGEMKDLSSRRELFTELSKLFRVTFVIPRVSHEETTVAVISFFPTEKGKKILRKVDDLLPYFRSAVKRWVKETEEGAAAFRYACDDLNIGDVVSHDGVEYVGRYLSDLLIELKIDCFVGEYERGGWHYDTRFLVT
jgi:hypothetical protein